MTNQQPGDKLLEAITKDPKAAQAVRKGQAEAWEAVFAKVKENFPDLVQNVRQEPYDGGLDLVCKVLDRLAEIKVAHDYERETRVDVQKMYQNVLGIHPNIYNPRVTQPDGRYMWSQIAGVLHKDYVKSRVRLSMPTVTEEDEAEAKAAAVALGVAYVAEQYGVCFWGGAGKGWVQGYVAGKYQILKQTKYA